jgi:iron complex outermembrane receptor protein
LLVHLRLDPDSTDGTDRPQTTAGGSPRHQASLQSSMDLPYHLEWDPELRYTDVLSNIGPSNEGIPAYWEMDMRVSWHATPHLELSLVGQNLLQYHHPETNPSPPALPVEIPRGFYGQTTWKW